MEIFTTYHETPLGLLKIRCSDEHVITVVFAEDNGTNDAHPLLQRCTKQLDEYFSGRRKTFELPLQQNGSSFQAKIWDLLMQIPFGKTITYQYLAQQYGDLKAIRAVASANGKNNLAIIVPCHRVIGSNHSLTGYAGGLWRKKWLLDHEAKFHHGLHQGSLLMTE